MASQEIPQDRAIVTRAAAKAAGLARYFTGKPCKQSHVVERVTVNGYCVQCRDDALSAFFRANKERLNVDRRARHAANPTVRREQKRLHRLANLKAYRERDRRIAAGRKTENLERALKWQRDNPLKVRAREARRRARKNGALGCYAVKDIEQLFAAQNGVCAYCPTPLPTDYHVDHFIPLARGGTNWPDNLRLACALCNASKGARDPFEFLASIGRLNARNDRREFSIEHGDDWFVFNERPG